MNTSGYNLLLPPGLLDFFDLVKVNDSSSEITIYLEEKNTINDSFSIAKYESKGFFPAVVVHDFPVRGKRLLLNLRRRRWIDKESGEYFHHDFHIIAQGTRITEEFASFLKGLHG